MKKVIRLTEGELNHIIKEVLNELDWKTYASAAKKRAAQLATKGREGSMDKGGHTAVHNINALDNMANQRLDNEFGNRNTHGHINTIPARGGYQIGQTHYDVDNSNKFDITKFNYNNNGEEYSYGLGTGMNYPVKDEIRAYLDGDYGYEKGKGWVKQKP